MATSLNRRSQLRRWHTSFAAAAIVGALLLPACSPTQQISESAQAVQAQAHGIVGDLDDARATGEVGPLADPFLTTAQGRARNIHSRAGAILTQIPKVQDVTPWWGQAIKWLALALAIGAILYLLIATGALGLIRTGVGVIGAMIPGTTAGREAKFDAEALKAGTADRERIAVKRTADPVYEAALAKEKSKLAKEPGS